MIPRCGSCTSNDGSLEKLRHDLTPDSEKLPCRRVVVYADPQMIPSRNAPGSINLRFDHGGNVIAAAT